MAKKNPFRRPLPVVPYNGGRRVALFNPNATVPIGRVFTLMRDKSLYTVLCETDAAKKLRTKRPLLAVKMLEENGCQNGLTAEDFAVALDITVQAARNAMNRAEYLIWEVFGLIVSFFGVNQPWRLLNHVEVALKYMQVTKGNVTKQKRAAMYANAARYHGQDKGELRAPLFQFDFTSPDTYAAH